MAKVKQPLLSFDARRKLGDDIVYVRRGGHKVVERRPIPKDARSVGQLSWRHMFLKVVALWHALSAAEKEAWESLGRKRHMTGYAWFVSQALRPNPGIYLPLQGGTMQGIIDMAGYAIQDLLDPVNPQDADTEAARDAAIADALEDCIDSHIHGWDGANWRELPVESVTYPTLRVSLHAGPYLMSTTFGTTGAVPYTTTRGYVAATYPLVYSGANDARWIYSAKSAIDGMSGSQFLATGIYAWVAANFYRLRAYVFGVQKVGRAAIGLSTPRLVAAGQVKAAAGDLYWMNLNPSAGLSAFELTDDLNGLGAVVLDHFDTTRDGHMITFDPPMEFSTGIYLKTFTNMTSITFGYL